MNRRTFLYLAALLLPTLFLGVQTAAMYIHRANASVYTVKIDGYDPRDLIYGEYFQFRILWDDPKSQKPADTKSEDLPQDSRIYLPEGFAYDLQTMIWERKNEFTASVAILGKDKAQARDIQIDGKPWYEALDAWRQNRDNANP